jgi:hypothetical protein
MFVVIIGSAGLGLSQVEAPHPPEETIDRLVEYARDHRQDPVEYVVKKFESHDIVFLGEGHCAKHDPEFVQQLIPAVYAKGIRNLGIEFACHHDQELIDKLLTARTYDEDLARRVMFREYVLWGYKEYLDLFRAAWKLNNCLAGDKPRFRIVGLNARADWSQLTTSNESLANLPEKLRVWPEGSGDTVMGRVILTEFVDKGQKALVYMGRNHAQTRYSGEGSFWAHLATPARAGRIVYQKIGDRACTILLHAPWPQRIGGDWALPVEGVIDTVLTRTAAYPTGFDMRGTPFGPLPDQDCRYADGHEPFTLQDFCDGYIFLKPLSQYEMVTADESFINAGNLHEAISQLPDPDDRKKCRTVADMQALIRAQAEELSSPFKKLGSITAKSEQLETDASRAADRRR